MGNVGCEKEPSILHRTARPSTHALHQNNQALACQPGWEWEEWPGMWLLSEFQRTRMRIWERMQNSRGGKKKNAAAFVVKEDFLYCQTARASVIPSNILRESGKIWKNWTLHKEGRLKKQTKNPKNYSSLHQPLFFAVLWWKSGSFYCNPPIMVQRRRDLVEPISGISNEKINTDEKEGADSDVQPQTSHFPASDLRLWGREGPANGGQLLLELLSWRCLHKICSH